MDEKFLTLFHERLHTQEQSFESLLHAILERLHDLELVSQDVVTTEVAETTSDLGNPVADALEAYAAIQEKKQELQHEDLQVSNAGAGCCSHVGELLENRVTFLEKQLCDLSACPPTDFEHPLHMLEDRLSALESAKKDTARAGCIINASMDAVQDSALATSEETSHYPSDRSLRAEEVFELQAELKKEVIEHNENLLQIALHDWNERLDSALTLERTALESKQALLTSRVEDLERHSIELDSMKQMYVDVRSFKDECETEHLSAATDYNLEIAEVGVKLEILEKHLMSFYDRAELEARLGKEHDEIMTQFGAIHADVAALQDSVERITATSRECIMKSNERPKSAISLDGCVETVSKAHHKLKDNHLQKSQEVVDKLPEDHPPSQAVTCEASIRPDWDTKIVLGRHVLHQRRVNERITDLTSFTVSDEMKCRIKGKIKAKECANDVESAKKLDVALRRAQLNMDDDPRVANLEFQLAEYREEMSVILDDLFDENHKVYKLCQEKVDKSEYLIFRNQLLALQSTLQRPLSSGPSALAVRGATQSLKQLGSSNSQPRIASMSRRHHLDNADKIVRFANKGQSSKDRKLLLSQLPELRVSLLDVTRCLSDIKYEWKRQNITPLPILKAHLEVIDAAVGTAYSTLAAEPVDTSVAVKSLHSVAKVLDSEIAKEILGHLDHLKQSDATVTIKGTDPLLSANSAKAPVVASCEDADIEEKQCTTKLGTCGATQTDTQRGLLASASRSAPHEMSRLHSSARYDLQKMLDEIAQIKLHMVTDTMFQAFVQDIENWKVSRQDFFPTSQRVPMSLSKSNITAAKSSRIALRKTVAEPLGPLFVLTASTRGAKKTLDSLHNPAGRSENLEGKANALSAQ